MSDPIGAIDNSPLFKLLTDIVIEGPMMLGRGALQLANGIAEGTVNAFHSVKETALGAIASSTPSGPEITPVKELSGPAQAVERAPAHHVDMAELGSFSPPSFGDIGRGGAGIGV